MRLHIGTLLLVNLRNQRLHPAGPSRADGRAGRLRSSVRASARGQGPAAADRSGHPAATPRTARTRRCGRRRLPPQEHHPVTPVGHGHRGARPRSVRLAGRPSSRGRTGSVDSGGSAKPGAEVTIATRRPESAEPLVRELATVDGAGRVHTEALCLSDPASDAAFARAWRGPLDILVANAGIMALPTRTLLARAGRYSSPPTTSATSRRPLACTRLCGPPAPPGSCSSARSPTGTCPLLRGQPGGADRSRRRRPARRRRRPRTRPRGSEPALGVQHRGPPRSLTPSRGHTGAHAWGSGRRSGRWRGEAPPTCARCLGASASPRNTSTIRCCDDQLTPPQRVSQHP